MKVTTLNLILLLLGNVACSQTLHLKSHTHALNVMNGVYPMDSIIEEIVFENGPDDSVSVIRFDHVYGGLYPLIISSKRLVKTDSLGHLSFKIDGELFENLLWLIDNVDSKFYTRNLDGVLIRVTYRYHGLTKQYYVTNRTITTAYFLMIEDFLKNESNQECLDTFYKFVSSTRLIKSVQGKIVWVEAP